MKKNSQKRKFGTILLSLAALFAVLFSTAACKTDSDDDELNSVTINPSEATINANGQTSLFADVDKKGSGAPVYKWEITSGGDYATLENATSATCVVTGKNTTASAQRVTVKCTVTFASTTKYAEATVTVSAAKAGLESVSIAGSAEIASGAETELTATPAFTVEGVSPDVSYTWTISEGSEYAELSESTTGTVTLIAKNTTTEAQTVTVKVSVTYDGTTKDATTTVKILAPGQVVENKVTSVSVSAEKNSIACDGSTTLTATAKYSGTPTITYTWTISAGGEYAELSSTTGSSVTLTGKNTTESDQSVTVKVSATDGTNTITTTKIVTVQKKVTATGNVIKASDVPEGWANPKAALTGGTSISAKPTNYGGYSGSLSGTVVSTRSQLLNAVENGGIIYVSGMIDMTDGMLPSSGTTSTTALDSFIKNVAKDLTLTSTYGTVASKVTSYATWKTWYAANVKSTADQSGVAKSAQSKMQTAWKSQIQLSLKSNTTIIGLDKNSGIKGGTISIYQISNVVLRNLKIQDAFDPFPKMEKNDGYNAEWDGVVVDGSKYVWIDHCTFEDTICTTDDDFDHVTPSDGVTTKNKWQTYDGLLDVKRASDFVTISYCKFANHDKTSIFGHSDSESGDANHLTVTQHHNYFVNCTQRLPRVRYASMHSYNNYFTNPSGGRSNSYCLGVAANAKIYAEANYFDSTVQYSADEMASSGKIYFASSNVDNSRKGCEPSSVSVGWTPSSQYDYKVDSASTLPTIIPANAGAGVWTVVK
ncbi:pectate lyase family protein [Treponema berlinense]|uniref:pectate lyase family protein n=1 Tax=Treponema berlinense TaxID=225004 RepID=UPI0023539E15|nr:hypothetical protein [Treponema berlinense]